jgi:opacity protein-like surface antigen
MAILKSDPIIKRWSFLLLAGGILLGAAASPAVADDAAAKPWNLSGSAGFQYDDNVTTEETDTTSNLSDKAAVIEISGSYRPEAGKNVGLELSYDFSQTLFEDLTDFDLQSHLISGSIENEINGYDVGLNYLYGRTLLGGDDFLSMHSVTPTLGRSVNDRWYVSLRYNYQNKDFISASNDGRDGTLNSGTIDNFLFFMDGKAYLSLGYQAEDENTDDDELDYFGHIFHARLKLPVAVDRLKSWEPALNVGLKYSDKDYSNITSSIGAERADERTTFTLGLDANLSRHVFANFDYEYIDAQSNLASSDFNENIVTFSVGVRY